MSSKYLDYGGLSYLWTKLKAHFQVKLVSGTNIKTINNQSILGSGNITVSGSSTSVPTANASAAFDSTAHMNSTDMTTSEVQDFVDDLEGSGNIEPQVTTFAPSKGSAYAGWGGCYYEKLGNMVHLHLGISGLTANTGNAVYTLPSAVRPKTSDIFAWGSAGTTTQLCHVIINRNAGTVTVYPQTGTYCGADAMYFI